MKEKTNHPSYFEQYKKKITKGDVLVCKKLHKQLFEVIPRYLNKTYDDGSKILKIDLEKGHKPIEFIEKWCLKPKVKKGEEPKFLLELWQKAFIEIAYGIVYAKDDEITGRIKNARHFTETFLLVGRKNGKSALAAALALYHLIVDGVDKAEVYSVATKKDQALYSYDLARSIIAKSKALKMLVKPRVSKLEFHSPGKAVSAFQALSSDAHTLDGLGASFLIVDEIHAHKTTAVYDVMKGGMGANLEPMILNITTAGVVRESIFDKLYYDISKNILNGNIDFSRTLPWIYELDSKKEFNNEEKWIKANPNLRVTKTIQGMHELLESALINPKAKIDFLTKHCNLPMADIEAIFDYDVIKVVEQKSFDIEEFRGAYCVVGVDLSKTIDLTAVAILFVKPFDPTLYVFCQGFLGEEQMKNLIHSDKGAAYKIWEEKGWLTTNPGKKVDWDVVANWIIGMKKNYELIYWGVGIDRWSSDWLIKELVKRGVKESVIHPLAQGAQTLNNPLQDFQGRFYNGNVNYQGNLLLSWALSNVASKKDINSNIRPIKERDSQRIDPFMAVLNGYAVLKSEYLEKKIRRYIEMEQDDGNV